MDYHKMDAALAAAVDEINNPEERALSVFIHTKHAPQGDEATFLEDLGVKDKINTEQIRGAFIPYKDFMNKPANENVFYTGDAAGFVEPVTGEGIYFAILSGILCARTILSNKKQKAKEYVKECNENIISHLKQASFYSRFLFEKPFNRIAMKKFKKSKKYMSLYMKILTGEIDYNTYFATLFKNKFNTKK